MSFDSLLNLLCTIQVKSVTQDDAQQKIASWSTEIADVPCRIDPAGGGRTDDPEVIYDKATHEMFMRVPSSITLDTKNYRILLDGSTYTILNPQNLYGAVANDHLELLLEKDE